MLSAIEAEFGVYIDESQLSPEMTVRCLEALVEEGSRNPPMMSFPGWGMQWWCRILRGFLQRVVIFPVVSLPYKLKVVGRENLEGITGPLLFASNHNLGLDNPLIIKAVPLEWRRRLVVAGAADLWKNPVWWIITGLVAVEGRIPVVPLRLYIHRLGFPARFPVLRRGRVEVRLGEPLSFSPGTDYQDATSAIEEAVKSL